MRLRFLVFAALGAGFMLSAAAPAFADRDDRDHHDGHADRDHHDGRGRGYYAPPVVVAPPAYGYYAPPPVYYGPPGINIGIHLP